MSNGKQDRTGWRSAAAVLALAAALSPSGVHADKLDDVRRQLLGAWYFVKPDGSPVGPALEKVWPGCDQPRTVAAPFEPPLDGVNARGDVFFFERNGTFHMGIAFDKNLILKTPALRADANGAVYIVYNFTEYRLEFTELRVDGAPRAGMSWNSGDARFRPDLFARCP